MPPGAALPMPSTTASTTAPLPPVLSPHSVTSLMLPRMQALLPPAPLPAPKPHPKWPAPAHDGLAGRFGLGLGLGVAS